MALDPKPRTSMKGTIQAQITITHVTQEDDPSNRSLLLRNEFNTSGAIEQSF